MSVPTWLGVVNKKLELMNTPKTAQGLMTVIAKLEKAQRKFPDEYNQRAAKIGEFKAALAKLGPVKGSVKAGLGSVTSNNNSRSGSVTGINHFRGWLAAFKNGSGLIPAGR